MRCISRQPRPNPTPYSCRERPSPYAASLTPWDLLADVRRHIHIEPEDFRDFAEPGWTKAAFSFRVDGCTVLTTETRVLATDDGARRKFGRYWRLIRPGSGAIRVAWLRAIRRHAERADTQRLAGAAGSG